MDFNKMNPKLQFDVLLKRKEALDKALKNHHVPEGGALDFTVHKLNKERKRIREDMAKINFKFTPDTLA